MELAPAPLRLSDSEVLAICTRLRTETIDMEAARRALKRKRVPKGERPPPTPKVPAELVKLAKKMGLKYFE